MKNEFIKFLKSKRLWAKFQKEFKNQEPECLFLMGEWFTFTQNVDFVLAAFHWNNKDFNIWRNVDIQWQEHLTKLTK